MISMTDERHVVLTGFMGTGKSSVGRHLAGILAREWVDTDTLIESRHGPIPQIFEAHGEEHFRGLERQLAQELAKRSASVVSTGGRMMLDPTVRHYLEPVSRIFCLVASPESILLRVGGEHGAGRRPLLAGGDPRTRIEELLVERSAGYAEFEAIDTDLRTAEQVAKTIASVLAP